MLQKNRQFKSTIGDFCEGFFKLDFFELAIAAIYYTFVFMFSGYLDAVAVSNEEKLICVVIILICFEFGTRHLRKA